MTLSNEPFSYSTVPLEDGRKRTIRVIELFPGQHPQHQIKCQLHTVSLDDSPYYEAISYCWGPPNFDCPIICNGRTLNITSTLHGALQRLRHPTQSRWLWADAICINQNPNALDERIAQVGIMRDIYENAQQVNIWLGDAENNSHQAIYIVRQLARHRSALEAMGRPSLWPAEKLEPFGLRFGKGIDSMERAWAAVQPFFDRPWFKRMWTVQEVAVTRHAVVFCGAEEIPWPEMVSGLEVGVSSGILNEKRALNPDTLDFFDPAHAAQLDHMQILQRSSKYSGYNLDSILSYLLWFRARQATNPLDKVFALLGLVKNRDKIAATIVPNYGMSVESLYVMLTRKLLEGTVCLDVLSSPRGPTSDLRLPSWVVDWSNSSISTMSLVGQSHFKYAATGASRSSVRFSQDSRVLELKGHVVDTISAVASVLHKSHAFSQAFTSWSKAIHDFSTTLDNASHNQQVLLEWEALALNNNTTAYHTGEPTADVFHKTLRAGLPREHNMKASYHDWRHNAMPGSLPKSVDSARHPWLFKGAVFLQLFKDVVDGEIAEQEYTTMAYGRRLGTTRNGYLALLPAETRVGDAVVLCEGGTTPLILRSAGWAFELVGDGYVHGMMQGELFRPLEMTPMSVV